MQALKIAGSCIVLLVQVQGIYLSVRGSLAFEKRSTCEFWLRRLVMFKGPKKCFATLNQACSVCMGQALNINKMN